MTENRPPHLTTVTTIYHDGQFWIAVIERVQSDGSYQVTRHIFGPEPSNAELLDWAASGFSHLRFSEGVRPSPARHNPKRLSRVNVKKQSLKSGPLPKAERTLQEGKRKARLERRKLAREETRQEQECVRLKKQEKRKSARRGRGRR